jgi:hypothetical protein
MQEARQHLIDFKARVRQNKKLLNRIGIYQCVCGYYHVGHNKYKRVKM